MVMEKDGKYRAKPTHLWSNYGQTYDKGSQNIQWRKDNLFNKWCWENWTTCKRMKLEHSVVPYTKINSKWIKDINTRPDTIHMKTLRGKHGQNTDIDHSNIFLDPPPIVMEIKTKGKWNPIKLKISTQQRKP